MDLSARVRRRTRVEGTQTLVADEDAISPVAHLPDPVGRGPVLERLLDHLAPAFEGTLPPDVYLWGPKGAGKTAVVTALVAALRRELTEPGSVIHTSTRTETPATPQFVYVDARTARSPASLYHALLSDLTDESVPRTGVGTDELRGRLERALAPVDAEAVLAVDHVSDPDTPDLDEIRDHLDPVTDTIAVLAVGRSPPDSLVGVVPPDTLEVTAYSRHDLVDVLTGRAAEGLADRALPHETTRRIADWAAGDAHDALAGLVGGVGYAEARGHATIQDEDLTDGLAAVPQPCQSLGRVVALSATRRRVLRALVDLEEGDRASVASATDAIADAVDLSPGTIRRFLYELASSGILERDPATEGGDGGGRPPSCLEPRFPTAAFRWPQDRQA